ncbi:28 kDa heat- and acid-stable phosphoprotein [Apiospora marii]|uniref:28 kDa heat- and acid-stable phosphoprotein n=1 Tax=Apiospora marii TaxID=335849 RepID=A0ABR1RUN8_9PEZI
MSGRGGPGGNSRGRGGKFKKFTRGGGKHFSRDLKPLDADGNEIGMWGDGEPNKDESSSEEESSEEESSDEDDAGPSSKTPAAELTREERRKQKADQKAAAIAKKKKVVQVGDMPSDDSEESSDDDSAPMPANPNHSKASRNMAKTPRTKEEDEDVASATKGMKKLSTKSGAPAAGVPMSRRERESMEAAAAKERYRKLHEAGKTDEAKADMARLALIREKRAAEAARKQAEKEERDEQESARRKEIEAKEAKKREAALGKPAKKSKK